jgi:crotonobetainyl-CoA:carnitine CoA-transferase CaiB-like acyl-CoA transferase
MGVTVDGPLGATLEGVRVIECAMLEPDSLGMILADLGADVIKVEVPGGDYVRSIGWPFVEGVSIMHLHLNRGKRSIEIDLRTDEGADVFRDLVRNAHVVIEGMRPGALARRGLGFDQLIEINPALVFCTLSGFGTTGPYRNLPSHGVGFDSWAGVAPPAIDERGFTYVADHTSIGTRVGGVWAALGICAALLRARETGVGCQLDVAQTDAAAFTNWLPIEGRRAHERPQSEVTGNPSDGGVRREPGPGGMSGAVRYQYYATQDGNILFMASERAFWENFCVGIGRPDMYERHPGEKIGDHALGDVELRAELREIFASRTTGEWVTFGLEQNCPISPVNDATSITRDPQFLDRMPWLPASEYGTDLLPLPIRRIGEAPHHTRRAPEPGEHTREILTEVLGYSPERIAALETADVFGPHASN